MHEMEIFFAEISTLQNSWFTNTHSAQMYPQKNSFSLYFHKNITCLSVGLLGICQVLSVSPKTVYPCVTTNGCCTCDMKCINVLCG